jgi:geranylgeranyl pyrophosphate synthase
VRFVQSYGGVDYSMRRAKHFIERAKGHLRDIISSPERDALFTASDYVVERAYAFYK